MSQIFTQNGGHADSAILPFIRRALLWGSIWSLLLAGSYYWNIKDIDGQVLFLATAEAEANWNKDLAFRRWATSHGGLYVKPDNRTPPNPYLAHLPNRDVVTTEGMKLTLLNPAFMMRQMTEEYEDTYGVKGRITGQVQLNPVNKPDAWELETLKLFETGLKERVEVSSIDGDPYLRLMRPMVMAEGCQKCHGHLGFKVGDIRGGVSVSVPLEPYLESVSAQSQSILVTHLWVWVLGLLVLGWTIWRAYRLQVEREAIEQTLRRSQKMDAIGQLTGGIAHDFNNILGIIMGNLEFLKQQVGRDEMALKRVMSADKAALRAASLTKQLLGFSRKESGVVKSININQLVEELDDLISRSITPGIEVKVELSENLWETEIDTADFEDTLLNLVLNARDAMSGGGLLEISTANFVSDGALTEGVPPGLFGEYVVLKVSDSGCGISPDNLERIYEPFFTTKPVDKGTGLGMSMVFGFVKRSGGKILVDTTVGEGTSVSIFLPRSQ